MAEDTVIAENAGGELMQDSVSRTLAIEMLDGVWKAGESLTLEFHDLDVEFHTLILHESGNELFAALSDTIATVLRGRVELGKYPMKPKPDALDAHDAVADAIAKGEPERARSAMLDIVDEVARALNFF